MSLVVREGGRRAWSRRWKRALGEGTRMGPRMGEGQGEGERAACTRALVRIREQSAARRMRSRSLLGSASGVFFSFVEQ